MHCSDVVSLSLERMTNFIFTAKHFVFFKKHFIYFFLKKGEGKEKEGEKHQCVVASHAPPTGTWPATQAYALTGN